MVVTPERSIVQPWKASVLVTNASDAYVLIKRRKFCWIRLIIPASLLDHFWAGFLKVIAGEFEPRLRGRTDAMIQFKLKYFKYSLSGRTVERSVGICDHV